MYETYFEQLVKENEPFPIPLDSQLNCAPFEEFLGMKIETAAADTTQMSMDYRVKLAQSKGYMHGGAIAALAHTTLALEIKKKLPRDGDIEILTFSLRFHRPVQGGTVTAIGRITDNRERDISGEVLVYNSKKEKVASFNAAYRKERARKAV